MNTTENNRSLIQSRDDQEQLEDQVKLAISIYGKNNHQAVKSFLQIGKTDGIKSRTQSRGAKMTESKEFELPKIVNNGNLQSKTIDLTSHQDPSKSDSYEELKDEYSKSESDQKPKQILVNNIESSSNSMSNTSAPYRKPSSLQIVTRITEKPEQENTCSPDVEHQLLVNDDSPFNSVNRPQREFQIEMKQAKQYRDESQSSENKESQKNNKLDEIAMSHHKEIMKKIGEAEPIFELMHKYAQGTGSPAWKRKQMRHKNNLQRTANNESESQSLSSGEEYDILGNDKNDEEKQKNEVIQEKLQRLGEKIPILNKVPISHKKYSHLFGYQIYDGYKPNTLAQTKDYLDFLTRSDDDEEYPEHIKEYLEKEVETVLPDFINQKHILRFDQNFECGNLDSAYIHNCEEYNLLMKVDSNTRGNTYWFFFGVQDFREGVTYRFNIYNFTRSMEKFYSQGMNVLTKQQSIGGHPNISIPQEEEKAPNPEKDWRYGTCKNIWFEASDIPRVAVIPNRELSSQERYRMYYSKLSFSYTFTQEDIGKQVLFAYALPYTYSDLLRDLEYAKKLILNPKAPISSIQASVEGEKEEVQQEQPTIKYLESKKYLNYDKVKNLGNYQNSNLSQLSPLFPTDNSGKDLIQNAVVQSARKIKTLNSRKLKDIMPKKKASAYDLQHDQITRFGNQQMYQKTSKLETQFNKDQDKIKEFILKDNGNIRNKEQNFEITTSYLYYKQEVIAQTMGGLNLYQLTLTKRREAGSIRNRKKHIIYIQSRLHAAETHGSFIMASIIREFAENYQKYDKILNNYIVKLLPMLNPDGVVIGNSRSSLAGVDLNRRWCNPNATMHPELYFLKQQMKAISKQSSGISIFCDLHGHNKMQNCFFYGCNKAPNEGLLSWTKTRLLPKVFAQYEPIFDFRSCKFSQEKTKYNTARVVVWNEFKVTNSFTLETSMFGKIKKKKNATQAKKSDVDQLKVEDFDLIGLNLLMCFKQFSILNKILEKEFSNSGNRWLKKKKLDEMTSGDARQKMQEQELLEKQKKLLIGESNTKDKGKKKGGRPLRHQSYNNQDLKALIVPNAPKKDNREASHKRIERRRVSKQQTNTEVLYESQSDNNETLTARKDRGQKKTSKSLEKEIQFPKCLEIYFTQKEFESAVDADMQREKEGSKKSAPEESDSEPSCDNVEIKEIFNEIVSEIDEFEILENDTKDDRDKNELIVVQEELSEYNEKTFMVQKKEQGLEDYNKIKKQLEDVQQTSRQLHEKLQNISKEVNKKINMEQLKVNTVQPTLVISSNSHFRGNWNKVKAKLPSKPSPSKVIEVPIQNEYNISPMPVKSQKHETAGPISGQNQSAINRFNSQISERNNQGLLPAVATSISQIDDLKQQNRMATSAARANKYKSRNSILSVSTFNIQNGLQKVNKMPTNNQVMPQSINEKRQIVNGKMIIGQSMMQNHQKEISPSSKELRNLNYTTTKKKINLASISKRQTMAAVDLSPIYQSNDFSNMNFLHNSGFHKMDQFLNETQKVPSPHISNQIEVQSQYLVQSENNETNLQNYVSNEAKSSHNLADIDIKRQYIQTSPQLSGLNHLGLIQSVDVSMNQQDLPIRDMHQQSRQQQLSTNQGCQSSAIGPNSPSHIPNSIVQSIGYHLGENGRSSKLDGRNKSVSSNIPIKNIIYTQPKISASKITMGTPDKTPSKYVQKSFNFINQQEDALINIQKFPKVIIKPSQIRRKITANKLQMTPKNEYLNSEQSPRKVFDLEEDNITADKQYVINGQQSVLQESLRKRRGQQNMQESRNHQIPVTHASRYNTGDKDDKIILRTPFKNSPKKSLVRSPNLISFQKHPFFQVSQTDPLQSPVNRSKIKGSTEKNTNLLATLNKK